MQKYTHERTVVQTREVAMEVVRSGWILGMFRRQG